MGLTHEAAQAIHGATDELLDAFLAKATETLDGGEALERELVDAVRRWAERQEEAIREQAARAAPPAETPTRHQRFYLEGYGFCGNAYFCSCGDQDCTLATGEPMPYRLPPDREPGNGAR